VPASTAFLVAALAAALAALTLVDRRRLVRVVRHGANAIRPTTAQAMRRPRAVQPPTFNRPRLLRLLKTNVIAPIALGAAVAGTKLTGLLRSPPRLPFERLQPLQSGAARMLRSTAVSLDRTATNGRAGARRFLTAAGEGFWELRERWVLRRRGVAPYLVSFAVAVIVGWLVGAH
jgi:hypothetical protein